MMKPKKLLKIISRAINYISDFLRNHPFGCFIGLLLLAFLGAGLVYYFYVLNIAPPPNEESVEINISLYKKILEQQKNRAEIIRQETKQNYPDIFK